MTTSDSRGVLVVGAGPAGLFLASELRRHGVVCRLVEKNSRPCDHARATSIQPRTLEILEQVGLVEGFLAAGNPIRGVKLFGEGNQLIAHRELQGLESPFPFEIALPQCRTEQLLIDHVTRRGQTIERNVELVSFDQDAERVRATLRDANGAEESVEVDYLVGCDGAHSTVRHQLNMHLEGVDYAATFAVADVAIDGPIATDEVTLYSTPTEGMFIVPLPEGRFLISCNHPDGDAAAKEPPVPGSEPSLDEMQGYVDRVASEKFQLHDPKWLAYFHCHKRLVPRFQVGRVFLVGDAAHVQSPAGGQGLNTGIQDGFNLAWKLALVLGGAARPGILESYHTERHHIARHMLALSDEMHCQLFEHRDTAGSRARKWIASHLAHLHLLQPHDRTADETRIGYHHSPCVCEHRRWQGGDDWQVAPHAGDRAPDSRLTAHPAGDSMRLFEMLGEPRHQLLIFEGEQERGERQALVDLAEVVAARYRGLVEPRVILCDNEMKSKDLKVLLDRDGATHRRYGAARPSLYVVRPDGYIGFRSPMIDGKALEWYFGEIFTSNASS